MIKFCQYLLYRKTLNLNRYCIQCDQCFTMSYKSVTLAFNVTFPLGKGQKLTSFASSTLIFFFLFFRSFLSTYLKLIVIQVLTSYVSLDTSFLIVLSPKGYEGRGQYYLFFSNNRQHSLLLLILNFFVKHKGALALSRRKMLCL